MMWTMGGSPTMVIKGVEPTFWQGEFFIAHWHKNVTPMVDNTAHCTVCQPRKEGQEGGGKLFPSTCLEIVMQRM